MTGTAIAVDVSNEEFWTLLDSLSETSWSWQLVWKETHGLVQMLWKVSSHGRILDCLPQTRSQTARLRLALAENESPASVIQSVV